MATSSRVAIFDSSAIVSLLNEDDQLHESALLISRRPGLDDWQILLPHEVFAETLNVIGKKGARAAVARASKILRDGHAAGDLTLVPSTPLLFERATVLQQIKSGGPSFIDCLVMAVAQQSDTDYIFGFDATFKKNGFRVPE